MTLLKSALPADTRGGYGAARAAGLIDDDFEHASGDIEYVELVNLRRGPAERYVIRQASQGSERGCG